MGSGSGAGTKFRLLDIAAEDVILVSLAILGLVSSVVAPWLKNPVGQWYEACRNCLVLSAKKEIRTGPSK